MSDSTTALPELWVAYITPFAAAIGKSPEDVTSALKDLVGEPGDEAISLLKNREFTSDADIVAAVGSNVPKAKLAKAIVSLREVAPAPAASDAAVPAMSAATFDVLPSVPSDEAWLSAFKVGGTLKFNKETVIGTVSAALAARLGLYDLPDKIGEAMEHQAESLEEPVGEEFYHMQNLLTRRNYSEIFSAIPGVDGRFATQARKAALLRRINERLWGSLTAYHQQLKQWVDAWSQSMNVASTPAALVNALRGGGGPLPPGAMQPPPTDGLRDAAEGVVNDINYVFAGTGIPVAMALAFDAQQIRKVLETPSLPAQVGAVNREQMLRTLGVAVSSDYPRLERNLKQYTLGVIELQNVTAGEPEYYYLSALFQLGAMIPWDRLDTGTGRGGAGIGRKVQL